MGIFSWHSGYVFFFGTALSQGFSPGTPVICSSLVRRCLRDFLLALRLSVLLWYRAVSGIFSWHSGYLFFFGTALSQGFSPGTPVICSSLVRRCLRDFLLALRLSVLLWYRAVSGIFSWHSGYLFFFGTALSQGFSPGTPVICSSAPSCLRHLFAELADCPKGAELADRCSVVFRRVLDHHASMISRKVASGPSAPWRTDSVRTAKGELRQAGR